MSVNYNDPTAPVINQWVDEKGFLLPLPWTYESQIARVVSNLTPDPIAQADIAKLTARLGRQDSGRQIFVTDYAHGLIWDGMGWTWTPGDPESGWAVDFITAGPNPATGWALCNGATVSYLKADGTLGSQALPTVAGRWFRQ